MPTTSHSTVTYSIDSGIAHVEIDRAEKLNALTREVFADLVEAGLAVRDSPAVKAVVVSGRGRAFSAGLDFTEMEKIAQAGTVTRSAAEEDADSAAPATLGAAGIDGTTLLGSARALAQKAVHVWSLVEVPVIAAIRGAALGGGLQIALGADMRVAGPDATLSLMEIKWGIIPDMCGTQLLPRLIGPAQAKKLIVTGETIGAEVALRIGLIEEVVADPVARSLELAAEIAEKSRPALVWAKRLVDLSYESELGAGLEAEQEALSSLLGTEEQQAAVAERRAQMRDRAKG